MLFLRPYEIWTSYLTDGDLDKLRQTHTNFTKVKSTSRIMNKNYRKRKWPVFNNDLRRLKLNKNFDVEVLPKSLPVMLTHLEFGSSFNQPVSNLPTRLTHLKFGYRFNQPIPNLPPTLTHLEFGYDFNQPVPNLPVTLTHLVFGGCFKQPVPDCLPRLTQCIPDTI